MLEPSYQQILAPTADYPALYRVGVPFDAGTSTNCYLLCGQAQGGRNLLIDTGVRSPHGLHIMNDSLTALGADLSKTDIFITHPHIDHIGLAAQLLTPQSTVYLSAPALVMMEDKSSGIYNQAHESRLRQEGVPTQLLSRIMDWILATAAPKLWPPRDQTRVLADGERLQVGTATLQVLHTPGHDEGHLCLWMPAAGIMFLGDHVLMEGSPNIMFSHYYPDILGVYLRQLERVGKLRVKLACPGHGPLSPEGPAAQGDGVSAKVASCALGSRIAHLRARHLRHLDELLEYLGATSETPSGFELAHQIGWGVARSGWDQVALIPHAFALFESFALLDHLVAEGRILRLDQSGRFYYRLA
jgi:glyoxylase-like metal-dependent hydrolase (beta-lactamase superfamily II)